MRSFAVVVSIALIGWSLWLAAVVLGLVLGGSRYVDWDASPITWWGELALAACCGVLAAAAAALILGTSRPGAMQPASTTFVLGLGFVAVGVLGIAAGWLGLQVPTTPGYDVLSRDEPVLILGGVAAIAVGVLVVVVSAVGSWIASGSGPEPE